MALEGCGKRRRLRQALAAAASEDGRGKREWPKKLSTVSSKRGRSRKDGRRCGRSGERTVKASLLHAGGQLHALGPGMQVTTSSEKQRRIYSHVFSFVDNRRQYFFQKAICCLDLTPSSRLAIEHQLLVPLKKVLCSRLRSPCLRADPSFVKENWNFISLYNELQF